MSLLLLFNPRLPAIPLTASLSDTVRGEDHAAPVLRTVPDTLDTSKRRNYRRRRRLVAIARLSVLLLLVTTACDVTGPPAPRPVHFEEDGGSDGVINPPCPAPQMLWEVHWTDLDGTQHFDSWCGPSPWW